MSTTETTDETGATEELDALLDAGEESESKPAEDKLEEPARGTDDERAEAATRAAACGRALDVVLREHSCVIIPTLVQENVGREGSKIIIGASYSVQPLRLPPPRNGA